MTIQSSGDFEIFCHPAGSTSRGSVPFFDKINVGDRLSLLFVPEGTALPPYSLKIFSPSGAIVLDSLVREPPTGAAYSPPPVEFVVSTRGVYRVEIRAISGRQRGEATIRVE
jgi:hypothetical protein